MPKDSRKRVKPRYVLLIEDNVHHAELITEVLDRHFAPVIIHTVDTVEDGLEFAAQSDYDLVITAGVIKGIPLTGVVPKLVRILKGTPVVVISGRGDERLAADFIKKGAAEYLGKSRETLDNLAALLEKHLTLKGLRKGKKPGLYLDRNKMQPENSSAELIREVDKLTQHALAISGPKRRRRRLVASEIGELDELLGRIQKLREIAVKLTPK